MSHLTIIHREDLQPHERARLLADIPGELRACAGHFRLRHERPIDRPLLDELRQDLGLDINTLPADFDPQRVKLIVSDMDSTLIAIECIDELADRCGLKPQVAAITDAAMRGELDFADALRQRVSLLEGLPVAALQTVYDERLRFNPGAATLIATARHAGITTAVVSGGFTFFTERVKARLGLDHALANELEIDGSVLTGRLVGAICGGEAKADFLLRLCSQLHIAPSQAIAIGDGANDLAMLQAAGLGVAYHAKPKLQAAADACILWGGLDSVCHFFSESQ